MDTFKAVSRYDVSRKVKSEPKNYRFLTLDECKALPVCGHCDVLDRNGNVAHVKITSVKTWKTRPDVLVGWKFGLYEYGKELITEDEDNRFFVIEINNELETKVNGKWEVSINRTKAEGYYQYDGEELGGLWFESGELADFDGRYFLPVRVADLIISFGYEVDKNMFCNV